MKCEHQSWVEVTQGRAGPQVTYGKRLSRLARELPRPSTQMPQVVFFVGRREKDRALRQVCSSNYRGQRHGRRCIDLRSDNRTLQTLLPRFFADWDFARQTPLPALESAGICHQDQTLPLALPADRNVYDFLLSRVLFSFVDVLCIFADDVGGLDGVRELLTTWVAIGSGSSLPRDIRPRVIVIIGRRALSVTQDVLDEEDFLFQLLHVGELPFYTVFADIQVSRLPEEELSSEARYLSLQGDILQQLRHARNVREHHRVLFSAIHLSSLFETALEQACAVPRAVFDFIQCARLVNLIDGAYTSHLINFVEVANKSRAPYDAIAMYLASTVLMDAYPPGMHRFCSSMIFNTLYRRPCYTALRHIYSTDALAALQCERIEGHLKRMFAEMNEKLTPSFQVHKRNVVALRQYWTGVHSNRTCLTCLRRSPEHPQACGHVMCDTCVQIFGEPNPHTDYEFTLHQCILCGNERGLRVRSKPPTAGPRVLSIDGGGPRAVIPLENLELLQEIVGPELPVPDMFELRVGTSSGGLISLAMTFLGLDVSQCKDLFQELARRVFSPARRKWLLGLMLSDEAYDTEEYENILKAQFGPSQRIFDAPRSMISSGKVAVTASTISDGRPYLFTNYNGGAPHRAEPVCGRVQADPEYEPFIWQVARATTAAPPLFSTIDIPGLGSFQDGGIGRHNNPLNLAWAEAIHLWPSIARPDVFISLGTGTEMSGFPRRVSRFRNAIVDGFIPRLYRASRSWFDGEAAWSEFHCRLDKISQENTFRLNTFFPTGLPAMDDAGSMESMSAKVRAQSGDWPKRQNIAITLLTKCLYFELDEMPEFKAGLFHCVGAIRCRMPPQPLINRLASIRQGRLEFFKDNMNLGLELSLDDICPACHRYSLPLRFFIHDLDEVISLSLRIGDTAYRLSMFPMSVQWFVDVQGLGHPFGSANHGVPLRVECSSCGPHAAGRSRKRKYIEI